MPVLRVQSLTGRPLAIVFGYACHNTTMQFYRWCGDYAGYAQENLEKKHKGAVAMFWSGCGGDANPLPRSKIELCKKYGKELADAVMDEGPAAWKVESVLADLDASALQIVDATKRTRLSAVIDRIKAA